MKYSKNHLPALCEIIEKQDFQEIKTSLEIRVNRQDTQTFVMQSSRRNLQSGLFYCFTDSIQNVIEKKRKKFVNLMKVISHELLNSITPFGRFLRIYKTWCSRKPFRQKI
jgi:hypothetical protein